MEIALIGSLIFNVVLLILLDRETEDHINTLKAFSEHIAETIEERERILEYLEGLSK